MYKHCKCGDLRPEISDDFGHWLAGLVAGDGCFMLSIVTNGDHQYGRAVFVIQMASWDTPIITEIHKRLACGSAKPMESYKENSHTMFRLHISDPCDLMGVIVPLFRKYPIRSQKAAEFNIFAQGAEFLHDLLLAFGGGGGRKGHKKWTKDSLRAFKVFVDSLKKARVDKRYS